MRCARRSKRPRLALLALPGLLALLVAFVSPASAPSAEPAEPQVGFELQVDDEVLLDLLVTASRQQRAVRPHFATGCAVAPPPGRAHPARSPPTPA